VQLAFIQARVKREDEEEGKKQKEKGKTGRGSSMVEVFDSGSRPSGDLWDVLL